MKRITKIVFISVMLFTLIQKVYSQDTLYIVNSLAIDINGDGDIDGIEIEFNQGVDDSEMDGSNELDDWLFSNYSFEPDFSANSVAGNYFETYVRFIAGDSIHVTDDKYVTVGCSNAVGGPLADDTSTPFYYTYTYGGNKYVITPDDSDTLMNITSPVYAKDAAPPKIISGSVSEIGGTTLEIDDTIKFQIDLFAPELGITVYPAEYNGSALNWTTEDDSTFTGTYVVKEGDPDQTVPLDLTDVYVKDIYNNFSDSVSLIVTKAIDANRPEIENIYFSPGDGNTMGIASVLNITIKTKNLESGLICDSASVNGKDVSGTFNEVVGNPGYYELEYTVAAGDDEINDQSEAIPVSIVLDDNIYLTTPAFYDSTINASPGVDATAPAISDVNLSVTSGLLGISDTIIFTINASEPGLYPSTIDINGKDLKSKLADLGGGLYEVEYVIKSGDNPIDDASEAVPISIELKDEAGNVTNTYNTLDPINSPGIDASKPSITNVTFSPTSDISTISDIITVTITASESNLTADSVSINGKAFAISGIGPYTINYTISEGDNDVLDSEPIPIYITLTDGANVSQIYKTSDVNALNCPGIDANRPGIKSVTFSPGHGNTLGIDSVLTVTLEAENAEAGLLASGMTINGVDVSGSLSPEGTPGFYLLSYTVLNGHGSINDGTEAIPVSFAFDDGHNITSPAFTNSMINSTPGIDDSAPVISGVTVSPGSGLQAIGDTITFTVNAAETGLTPSSIIINSKNLINKVTDLGTGFYEIEYVVKAGDNDISDDAPIPISITFKDKAGNNSNNFNSLLFGNCPGVDAHKPVITGVTVTEQTMLYGNTYTLSISVNTDADSYNLVSGTIAGFNLKDLIKNTDDKYFVDFTVGDLGYDIQPGDTYDISNLLLADAAGNLSNSYAVTVSLANDPIYTILPSAKVKGTHKICEKDSAELTLQLTGSAPWSVELFDGTTTSTINSINESPYIHKMEGVDINGATNPDTIVYKITEVTDAHGNIKTMTVTDSAIVYVYEIPVVDITDPPGNKTYNIEAKADTLVGNPLGGIFSGNGIVSSNNTFLASSAGVGTHDIVYKYTEPFGAGCFNSDTVVFTVDSTNATITFDNSDDDWRCDYESYLNATAEVIDKPGIIGNLYLPAAPSAITDWGNNSATIDIQKLSAGTYEIKFVYDDGGTVSITRSFNVESVSSSIDITNITDQCEDHDTLFVNTFNLAPSGGTGQFIFSGNSDDYFVDDPNGNSLYFYPDSLDPDSYSIQYTYTTPNGCESDPIIKTFKVYPLPTVSFSMNSVYNIDQGASTISGNPLGSKGVFTPLSFMSNNGDGTASFDPSDAGLGTHRVRYTYEDANGCVNSDSTEIEVTEALGDIISSKGSFQFCYWGTAIDTLTGTPLPTDGTPGTFYIDDVAVTPESVNKIVFNPKDYLSGDHTVRFEYYDGPTLYKVFQTINVDSVGEVAFTDITNQCEDYDTIFINAFNLSPTGGTGEFIFSGEAAAFEYEPSDSKNNSGYLLPEGVTPGNYSIEYIYTSPTTGCPSDTAQRNFEVYALPTVSFTMNPTYNIDQGSNTITGNPLGATGVFEPLTFMSNNGDGTALFDPADAGLGYHWVKYTYEDGNGCTNTDSTEILVNQALGSITSSKGTFKFCYFGGEIDTLTGIPVPSDGTPGSFYIDDVLIPAVSDNKIVINPQDFASGDHTVKYTYTDGSAPYEVFKTINIDSIGNIYFTGLENNYCEDEDTEVELTAFYLGSDGTMTFSGDGITDDINDNLGYFNPSNANVGVNTVLYTFIRDYSGCTKTYTKNTRVNEIPYVNFHPNKICISDPTEEVGFVADTLLSDSIINWEWRFGTQTSIINEKNPSVVTGIGDKTMRLKLTTNKGCTHESSKSFYIGTTVDIKFTFENECHGELTKFEVVESTDPFDLDTVRWNFGGSGVSDLSDSLNPTYIYDYPGEYNVIYEEFTKSCGRIADTITINVRPSVDLSSIEYIQDFEKSPAETGWVTENFNEESSVNSWQWGEPLGQDISSASSGQNAFVTNLNGSYGFNEKGMVTSPCFDFSEMHRPMMKMDYISYTERDRDGVVIQYTKPNGEWATIGVPNDGVNWYNSYIISGSPANQQLGWTGEITGENNGWQTAMYRLDDLRGRAGVRFRIVFGSDAAGEGYEGFAFDNIEFSERKRTVLLENFTNITDDDAVNILNGIASETEKDSLDAITLNYHTNFPQGNSLNSFYPSGPSARALFYGTSSVPYSIIDGESKFSYLSGQDLNESDIHKRMLIDPWFDISVKQDIQAGNLVVSSDVRSMNDLTGYKLLVFVAVVEKTVTDQTVSYKNVLRAMLPDAAGSLIERDWLIDDKESIYQTWTVPEEINSDSLMTIVFVQDEESKEIYQTAYTSEFSEITSAPDILTDDNNDFSVYPNPVKNHFYISLNKSVHQTIEVGIYNELGKLIKAEVIRFGETLLKMDIDDLTSGIYFVKLNTANGEFQGVSKIIKSE